MTQRRKKRYLKKHYPQCQHTQQELAAILGVSQEHISRVLNGEKTPSLPLAIRMANMLGVPVSTFNKEPKQNASQAN